MMRVTTNSMVRNYNSSLASSLSNLSTSRERVYSGRQFTHAYEDPASASLASQLRRQYAQVNEHISSITNIQGRQDSAESTLTKMITAVEGATEDQALQAINGTSSPDVRAIYATSLEELQKALIQFSNTKYGNEYLFAGADGANTAFSVDQDTGAISYRGIDVTTGLPVPSPDKLPVDDPNYLDPNDPDYDTKLEALKQKGLETLKELSTERLYADIGIGITTLDPDQKYAEKAGDFNSNSAFDMSLPGVQCFGYGSVEGTDPPISKNMLVLLGQMSDELKSDSFDADRFAQMREQMGKCYDQMTTFQATMGVKTNYLTTTQEHLKDDKLSLTTQLDALENIDPAQAIMDYSYSQYSYNMILKVGTSLLSNSLIDFMK